MDDIKEDEKLASDDQDIIFEGDNWIGANVTILKGVTIGRGAVVCCWGGSSKILSTICNRWRSASADNRIQI